MRSPLLSRHALRAAALVSLALPAAAPAVVIEGPAGSARFGSVVAVLPNGNVLVTDPFFDLPGGPANVGAIWLYRDDGTLVSRVTGSQADDRVGSGITVLPSGNALVYSPFWSNGQQTEAGAVVFIDGDTGTSGEVSAANSLVGSRAADLLNEFYVVVFDDGNFAVVAPEWDNGPALDAGAVVFGDGDTGVVGPIGPANALVGSTSGDTVGIAFGDSGVIASGGRYAVVSPSWDGESAADIGAITIGSTATGVVGAVSSANSATGAAAGDGLGAGASWLPNGDLVVRLPAFDAGPVANVGLVARIATAPPRTGPLSATDGLTGSVANDSVGNRETTVLANGNYVVRSTSWDNGAIANAGAATWVSATAAGGSVVSATNSLVGGSASDTVSSGGVDALSNGNYVVRSLQVDLGGLSNVGAATFGNGTTGTVGTVAATNSLVGSAANNSVGNTASIVLDNGNYVVVSTGWDNGATSNVGALTWGDGTTGTSGAVSAANSLVGSSASDIIGGGSNVALPGGRFLIAISTWNNGAIADAGFVGVFDGNAPITGTLSAAQGLAGNATSDRIGGAAAALGDGRVVVLSPLWNDGPTPDVGALTLIDPANPPTGAITATNSITGHATNSGLAAGGAFLYGNGIMAISTPTYDEGALANVGAVTIVRPGGLAVGPISASNSVVGPAANAGIDANDEFLQTFDFAPAINTLVIGRPAINQVEIVGNAVFRDGFEPALLR